MPNDMNTSDQILNLIDKSKKILLLTHAKADCDGLGSMISMYMALKELGKEVVAATNDPTPDNLSFLPSMNIVQNSLRSVEDFIITLDVSQTPLKKIRYHLDEKENGKKDSKVNIIITPKIGQFKERDVSFSTPEDEVSEEFDLIMTFDTGNLEHLGPLYDKNTELFFKTPLVNIDHHASNTDFGQVNLVDVVAASTTEVMLGLLQKMEEKYSKTFINEDVATLLLAGLITDTGSFQHANTSPVAMEVAAELLDLGARQQEIIKNIYKSKNLSTLKLWGIILSKVQSDPIYRMVWSDISKEDLEEAKAHSDESEGIIDDLLSNAPGAEVVMLFKWNEEGYISVSMRSTTNSVDVGKIANDMGGGGHVRAAGFKIRDGKGLEEVMQMALKKVRDYQADRLNIHPDTVHQPMEEAPKKITQKKEQKVEKDQDKDSQKEEKYLDFDSLDATDEAFLKTNEKKEDKKDTDDTKKSDQSKQKKTSKIDEMQIKEMSKEEEKTPEKIEKTDQENKEEKADESKVSDDFKAESSEETKTSEAQVKAQSESDKVENSDEKKMNIAQNQSEIKKAQESEQNESKGTDAKDEEKKEPVVMPQDKTEKDEKSEPDTSEKKEVSNHKTEQNPPTAAPPAPNIEKKEEPKPNSESKKDLPEWLNPGAHIKDQKPPLTDKISPVAQAASPTQTNQTSQTAAPNNATPPAMTPKPNDLTATNPNQQTSANTPTSAPGNPQLNSTPASPPAQPAPNNTTPEAKTVSNSTPAASPTNPIQSVQVNPLGATVPSPTPTPNPLNFNPNPTPTPSAVQNVNPVTPTPNSPNPKLQPTANQTPPPAPSGSTIPSPSTTQVTPPTQTPPATPNPANNGGTSAAAPPNPAAL